MGYSLHQVENFGEPFLVVHEQIVVAPAKGFLPVYNASRKILFILSGDCQHEVVGAGDRAGRVVHLRPGDILALPHRCEQRYQTLHPGTASRLHVVRLAFNPVLLPPLPLGIGEEKNAFASPPDAETEDIAPFAEAALGDLRYLRGAAQAPVFHETLTHLRDEARYRFPGYRLRVQSLCVSLTVLFARQSQDRGRRLPDTADSEPSAPEFHVGKMKHYLRRHLRHSVGLGEAAKHVGLSEEYTARLFKKTTGVTVGEYLRRLRLAEAKTLLATTEHNLSEIARLTGFASLTVFSRNFKAEAGVTPSEFRRQVARDMG